MRNNINNLRLCCKKKHELNARKQKKISFDELLFGVKGRIQYWKPLNLFWKRIYCSYAPTTLYLFV